MKKNKAFATSKAETSGTVSNFMCKPWLAPLFHVEKWTVASAPNHSGSKIS